MKEGGAPPLDRVRQFTLLNAARGFVDRMVHEDVRADAFGAARHAAFISSQLATGLLAALCFPPYLAVRGALSWPEVVTFVLLLSPILVAVYLSRTGRFETANIFSIRVLCALATVIAFHTGGLRSFVIAWLFVAPFEAMLSGSRRVVFWAVSRAVLV
jgi:cell cycle sensor histidine kinase DivJ